ncbi:MAG TPA: GNAT family N-acetyltransferase [Rhodocyclaceae bacterium]
MTRTLTLSRVDLADPGHGATLLALLDHYAGDPMGGGKGLDPAARERLLPGLRATPHYRGALAFCEGEAVGLINCFLGFSTFAAMPLLNVHDIVVLRGRRGEGIGQALLSWAETIARDEGCCKLTLEVLSNNRPALQAYQRAGFAPYVLDPAAGQALFLQRIL